MSARLFALVVTVLVACSAYDPELLRMRDSGVAGTGGGAGDGGDEDAGQSECRVVPDSPCAVVCIERCNGLDDDCDGIIDNNSASSSCDLQNGEAACDEGVCRLVSCQGDYADCNGIEADGCEVLLPSNPNNCGLCQAECTFLNATALCFEGQCVKGECEPNFGDCDGQPSNGCETSLTTLNTCGTCEGRCVVGANALPTCDSGVCQIAECVGNFDNCDGDVSNGCEQALDDPENCGACGATCAGLPNATATCGETGCEGLICLGEYQDCNGLATDGCEALLSEPNNCGACGNACDLPNVAAHLCDMTTTATCTIDDTATNGGCDPGFADCNGTDADGCERPLNTITDCGACDTACTFANGIGSCETGTCVLVGCGQGSNDCNNDGVCDSLADDPNNCGACENVCAISAPVCSNGRCRVGACPSGTADCDANDADCETDITRPVSCGSCTNDCTGRPNTTGGTCSAGVCQITCATGFANCNGDIADGCETDTRTLTNCGACGTTCSIANATATCATGSCRIDTCASTHRDCDMNNTSCETSITLPTNCGSCTNDCTGRPNTTGAGCNAGVCSITCAAGFRDCDMMATTGCEVAINTTANCGSCGNNCATLANVSAATCNGTSCAITTCASGFRDCDGLPSNGCERSITTTTDCGACNNACSFANAAAACTAGACAMGACSTGFADCDMSAGNGCETQLNSLTNCGACGTTCAMGQVCNNGVCASASCPTGQSYCGGTTCIPITGRCAWWCGGDPVRDPGTNCGGCGNACNIAAPFCCL